MARILILNGIGSVGKSSTAKALQKLAVEPFLNVPGDAFLDMIPPQMWGHPDGILFEQSKDDDQRSIKIEMGKFLDQLMNGMRASVAALAKSGLNCIVDDVMLSADAQQAYRALEIDGQLQFVGLHAPLSVLEQRERDRGDRLIGLASWQFERVHHGIEYDFEIDTSDKTPAECAQAIAAALHIPTSR